MPEPRLAKLVSKTNGRWLLAIALLVFAAALARTGGDDFACGLGEVAVADLGEGVVMRTCLWQKQPGVVVRTGPMELIKNGILILKARTNREGRLHGLYSSWDDDGQLMERGFFAEGLKQGYWTFADGKGRSRSFYYRAGVPLGL